MPPATPVVRAAVARHVPPPPRKGAALQPRRRESVVDYGYVLADLRRIGLIAGGLVALLIALSFVVR